MKDGNAVIEEFNELVNMKHSELESWLKSDDPRSAGWPKEDDDGESVEHDSGCKIVDILKANPGKIADKYTEDQIQHMRKVVSYCKRHLAQEEKGNSETSAEDINKTKSYASLKNWGHDMLKTIDDKTENGKKDDNYDDNEKEAGDKRKAAANGDGPNKKLHVMSRGKRYSRAKSSDEDDIDVADEEDVGNDTAKTRNATKSNGEANGGEKDDRNGQDAGKESNGPEVGDTVSWNWGGGQPNGKVLDVKDEETTITTKRGNEVSRKGQPDDPAVVLDTGKSTAIKLDHELN